MRLAGSPEIFEALATHFTSDQMPRPAAGHMAAEVMVHGQEMDTSVERFQQLYRSLRDQGYSDEAAQHLAVEALEEAGGGGEGREPAYTQPPAYSEQ